MDTNSALFVISYDNGVQFCLAIGKMVLETSFFDLSIFMYFSRIFVDKISCCNATSSKNSMIKTMTKNNLLEVLASDGKGQEINYELKIIIKKTRDD